jgi:hypothetical protein
MLAIGHFKLSRVKDKARVIKQKILKIYGHMFVMTMCFKNAETLNGLK